MSKLIWQARKQFLVVHNNFPNEFIWNHNTCFFCANSIEPCALWIYQFCLSSKAKNIQCSTWMLWQRQLQFFCHIQCPTIFFRCFIILYFVEWFVGKRIRCTKMDDNVIHLAIKIGIILEAHYYAFSSEYSMDWVWWRNNFTRKPNNRHIHCWDFV